MPTWRSVSLIAVSGAVVVGLNASVALADDGTNGPPVFLMTWDASDDQVGPDTYDPSLFATTPTIYGTWTLGSPTPIHGAPGAVREVTGWRYRGGNSGLGWLVDWDCVVNPDPFVDATLNITNTSAVTQTFFVDMSELISPIVGPQSLMNGSVDAVITNQGFAPVPAIMTNNGAQPIYDSRIDGNNVPNGEMWQTPFALSAVNPLSTNSAHDEFSNQIGEQADTSISLRLEITLTPGDMASVTGIFNIVPVPGPAALSLLAVAGVVAGGRRRRA
jgi:hypothetical protein